MSRFIPEMLMRNKLFKSLEEIQQYRRMWDCCQPFKKSIEKRIFTQNQDEIVVGLYPTMRCIGLVFMEPNGIDSLLILLE